MGRIQLQAVPRLTMARQRNVLLAVCLISLATLWGCRLPRICLFDQCNADITRGPLAHRALDLSDPDAPFVGWPLARVCAETTTWTPGLVFICDNNSGGIGNIRNFILTCLRYAIEAGATGLVMPQIRTRSVDNLADLMMAYKEFDYFFDGHHFRTGLATHCPQMTIFNQTWDIPNLRQRFQPEMITPRDFGLRGGCDQRDLNRHADLFGSGFHAWLRETAAERKWPATSQAHPRVIRLNWGVQWDWPVYNDGPEFVATYGGLLRFREDILELGKAVSDAMRRFAAETTKEGGGAGFAGFHLRTEKDALKGWPNFDDQTTAYLREASHRGFGAGYLATGDETEAAKFVGEAKFRHQMRVATKNDLLQTHPDDMQALQALSWDQQAIVDYLVLLWSDYFVGVSPSSFSMTVALKRHLQMDGLYTRPWKIGREGDGRSWLVGKFDHYWDDWLFMYESLWP
ncbi:hypothetical protein QBC33DRAFT_547364 [Phialemonium atrogriseum]|uniref:Alternative oxidase n=1 Tax=Phialemonium atrogriseum TaxID=1093897 RepID=A0AAJ0BWR0_9PEZI|nr:uncharacterized protein QBC33DRAFT_547364 [Phialemonium atrogriseum]KAK1764467.1 hypothetical protein QBC33DRAFT_547364 [Phialemonium atrogriseum]